MRVTIDIRDDLLVDATTEFGDDGSNDAEHDLLVEVVEAIRAGAPELPQVFTVEQTETFRVRAVTEEEAMQLVCDHGDTHTHVEWIDTNRRIA
jgi:hypothetical protein